jgi:hypothetical protein
VLLLALTSGEDVVVIAGLALKLKLISIGAVMGLLVGGFREDLSLVRGL